ncbi:MAG TPA: L,D-transpeptidase family protein [Candidatus Polarisedimenticolia bacterium]|jgi:murein L,D-transpeptidase YcbB/YkuD|nr:L,D-transpeptidase family protein [Candidatus Polarisedimenticolia bacterium]
MPALPLRSAFPAALAALLLAASCRAGAEVPDRLQQILAGLGDRGGHPQASSDELREALQRQLRLAPVPDQGANRPSNPAFPTRATLTDFYARRGQRLAWSDDAGSLRAEAGALVDALAQARRDGLDPAVYAVASIDRLRASLKKDASGEEAVARRADLDLLLTTAFFRYASDLSTGRVHPNEVRTEWLTEPPELDLAAALEKALAAHELDRLLASLAPPHPGYARLRDALAELRTTAEAGGWPAVPAGPALKKGSRDARVAALRQRLGVRAGLLGAASGSKAAATFDARLDQAVRDFQERHGLEPDGVAGKTTIAALNVPIEERIRQVELNLERWRWMPRRLGDPHVEVNVPGFELRLVQGDRSALTSRVVAGSAFTPTPIFTDRIVAVVANPPWNVPRELAVREYLPELRLDPKLFQRHGIRIYEAPDDRGAKQGRKDREEDLREVDPEKVKWKRVQADEFDYVLRQDPGPDNALGRMKFGLTNDFQIYLHDTPARTAFDQTSRDLSHGCIRVEQAHELATAILGDAAEHLEEALQTTDERSIPVQPPVPIQILYLTAWVDEEKGLRFAPDVYEFDAPQQEALARMSRTGATAAKK